MDDEMQVAFVMRMFELEMTPEEQSLGAEAQHRVDNALDRMDPAVRDEELYRRMSILVGAENLMVDTTLSTKDRYAVTISGARAAAYNEQNRCTHVSGSFAPLAVHSKYYYTKDGTLTTGLLLGMSDVMNHLGAAASMISESLGEKIAPVMTVPMLRRNEVPSGRPITQLSAMGTFKYGTCMGYVDCEKMFKWNKMCDATIEPRIDYASYGVTFDDDLLGCKYTCQLCERFGLQMRTVRDPSVSNTSVNYIDCEMYPGWDWLELVVGTTLSRLLAQKYQLYGRALLQLANFGATAYNAMCDAMEPGSGGFCPEHCDGDLCTGEHCRAIARELVNTGVQACEWVLDGIKAGACWTEYGWCKGPCIWCSGCERKRDRCLNGSWGSVCEDILEYVVNDALYHVCMRGCDVVNTVDQAQCEARHKLCQGVSGFCDWTGRLEPPDASCATFMHDW